MLKTLLASAALVAMPALASALTINGGDYYSDAVAGVSGAGMLNYEFTAGENIQVHYSTSGTPDNYVLDFTSVWSSAASGGGTVFSSSSGDEQNLLDAGAWTAGETRHLYITWSGVAEGVATIGVVVSAAPIASAPLPAGMLLLGSGLAALGMTRRRKA